MNTTIETTAAMDLTPGDLNDLVEELRAYHAIYSPLFQRREQREWAAKYLHGLLLDLPRKSIEPLVLALEGAQPQAVRAMQQFISEGSWDDTALLHRHWEEVDRDLGEDKGTLILDGSDFPKQGLDSVGVKRQYCGALGKRANCQAGVCLGYASRKGYTLLDRRLYLPHEWVTEAAYAERRRRCGVPKEMAFTTKPLLGWEMIHAVHQVGPLRCRWVTCDEAFGRDTDLLDRITGLGLWYLAEVPHDTRVWQQRPATVLPPWSGQGRPPTRLRVLGGDPEATTVAQLAAAWPAKSWRQRTIKEGSKGPLVADFAAVRVIAVRGGLPGPEVWVVLRRNPLTGELKTYLSNAPAKVPLATLVRQSGMRWPIETCFEEGKQALGMGEYEVRSWRGWHHHMTLVILAHFFLVRMRLRLKKSAGFDPAPGAGAAARGPAQAGV
jgi:SRSO17 transposase